MVILLAAASRLQDSAQSITIYDSNPSHLWNRLYAALWVREDRYHNRIGEDSLDPLLWLETTHLLSEPSHSLALRTLDEFLHSHGETLISDPAKKAMLQRDLWAVFDWTVSQYGAHDRPHYEKETQELQSRLAQVLRRLELTPDELKALPDNYAQAVASGAFAREFDPSQPDRSFLPLDLFDTNGPWVCIQPSPEFDFVGVAPMHIVNFSGRSGFFVFVRLPGGRKATMDYFQSLWNFPEPHVPGPIAEDVSINPDLPSFPAGTQVALVRRATFFDTQGNLNASPLTESVQIRVYRTITPTLERFFSDTLEATIKNSGQTFYEIRLSRPLLFAAKNGGLRALGRHETEFSTFQQQGDDPIDGATAGPSHEEKLLPTLQTCVWCHSGGGVRSLNSRASLLKPNRMQQEPKDPNYGPIYWGDSAALAWKENHYDWGLLNGYWRAASPMP
jgi:hypothetical protein